MRLLTVNFHYYREETYRGGIYPVSESRLRHQVEALAKSYKFVAPQDLLDWHKAGHAPDGDFCLLTFDDGFAEQMAALDVLSGLSIPALFFVTTQPFRTGRAHNVHKLHRLFAALEENELTALLRPHGIEQATIDPHAAAIQYRYDTDAMRRIKFFLNFVLPEAQRDGVIDDLFRQIEPDEAAFVRHLYMGPQDWRKLAALGLLGTHSDSHRPLATLEREEIAADIALSLQTLQAETGQPVRAISYPYGSVAAVSDDVVACAKEQGLALGFTMKRGFNGWPDLQGGLRLCRVDTNDAPGGKNQSQEYCP